ncbi:DNA repair protein RecO [Gammaproteobacteria bacterium 53_120_T64]|nr:DNA repair protein RecO [Gammaproteobacteria bacterium 53_120_T64]
MLVNGDQANSYILHTRNYRESSQLVDFFSRDFGRLRAVTKGGRGKRKVGGHQLQAFTPLFLSWRGKGDLKNLTGIEAAASSVTLRGEMLYIGLYLNELLLRLLPEYVPHEILFDSYGELIVALGSGADPEPLLRRFELLLLNELGYGLDLTTEHIEGHPVVAGEYYQLSPDQGLIRIDTVLGRQQELGFSGEHLLAIAENDYRSRDVRRCAKRLLRGALQAQLGGRPLLSRQLFRQANALRGTAQGI